MRTSDQQSVATNVSPSLYRIVPLQKDHDRAAFRCGKDPLDRFIQDQVYDWVRRQLAQVYVLIRTDESTRVLGYFTLNMTRIDASDLPSKLASKFPRSAEIGAVLLGKLAVDLSFQGQGLGRDLLMAALDDAVAVSGKVAAFAVVVDAIDGDAAAFYRRHGFEHFPERSSRLFLPMTTHAARIADFNAR